MPERETPTQAALKRLEAHLREARTIALDLGHRGLAARLERAAKSCISTDITHPGDPS